jgi:hypothetical protein
MTDTNVPPQFKDLADALRLEYAAGAASQKKTMTALTINEMVEQQEQRRFAAGTAKRAALEAAGGLASDKTLRDEFAGQALAGVMVTCQGDTRLINETTPEMFARKTYEVADAMLEARKTTGEGEA